jgi:multiple sugar transport system permease protein
VAAIATRPPAPGPLARVRRWAAGFKDRDTWAAYAFLSPWLFGFVVFTAGPMVASAILSFTDYSIISATHDVGWRNYHQLIHDPDVSLGLRNTFTYTVLMVPSTMVFSLILAIILARVGRAAGFFRTVFYLPTMTPYVAVGVLYIFLFNGGYGLIDKALGYVGINGPYWTTDPHWIKRGLVVMSLWQVGSNVIIYLAAIKGVPQHLYEAAAIDGAGWWRRFKDVTLPMISPALFFTFIILTIAGLQTFDQVFTAFFNQSSPYGVDAARFFAIYLFQQAFTFFHMGYASALAWLLFAIVGVITAVQFFVSRRFVYYEGGGR